MKLYIGENIKRLRRLKNITQETLAERMHVSIAAVSKWENGYTLPDILMLCALADFFGVTTDELLDRNRQTQYAVIVANEMHLGQKIQALAERLGIQSKAICMQFAEAVDLVRANPQITQLLLGHLGASAPEIDFGLFADCQCGGQEKKLIFYAEHSDNETDILTELESCLTR